MQNFSSPSVKKNFDVSGTVKEFISDIKYDRVAGTYATTAKTIELFKDIIQFTDWTTAKEILHTCRTQGKVISASLPMHSCVGNMVRRIMKIIREEYGTLQRNKQDEAEASLHRIVSGEGAAEDYGRALPELEEAVIAHISEFQAELEASAESIAAQACEHIHTSEVIMTLGESGAVEGFLGRAAASRKFEVIIASSRPQGRASALRLARRGLRVALVPESAAFGMMARANKVIVGTQTVLADGGLRAPIGTAGLALAARHYSVPVLVLAPLYRFCPEFLSFHDQASFNQLASPEGVLSYADGDILSSTHVYNPLFDYVPSEHVTLFISNAGGHSPSYVYRLLTELYHQDDYNLL